MQAIITDPELAVEPFYDEKAEVWWFSIVDIIQVLTQQPKYKTAQNYWKVF